MKVLIISSYIFGYMDFAVEEIKRQGHETEVFYYDKPPFEFRYKNFGHKILSGISKIFGANERKNHRFRFLKDQLKHQHFDKTLVVHGQYLDNNAHLFLKSITSDYIAFFFDSLAKMPRQKNIIQFFDKIYSYEPKDCDEEGFLFLTNFIPTENYRSSNFKYTVFNICSLDHRLELFKKIASYLKQEGVSFEFHLVNKELKSLENFKLHSKRIDVDKIFPLIKDTKIILDINRNDQAGLSFRPFEALGNDKKLITNNPNIKSYEFYNPNNILVIDENNISIPKEFIESEYQKLPLEVYDKFSLKTWVENILK